MGSVQPEPVKLIDIRRDKSDLSLRTVIQENLHPPSGSKPSLPTLLLYDEKGLRLFERITYLDEYYPTNAEIDALERHASSIAARIPAGARLVELGSGNLRKVLILLQALEAARKPADYFALDLSEPELHRTFAEVNTAHFHYVTFNALHGTYDDGLAWLAEPENKATATVILTLGSSIGNFPRADAAKFLASFQKVLGPDDLVLVGLDRCQRPSRVLSAYNDSQGVTTEFYRNGLEHANRVLGRESFKQSEWAIDRAYDKLTDAHQASYIALSDVVVDGVTFNKGDKLFLEHAHKYSEAQCDSLWHAAGLVPVFSYSNDREDYSLNLLSSSTFEFPTRPNAFAPRPVPDIDEWRQLWTVWDVVTRSMVPREELLNKPIQLRNSLIFYLGHIPTFADIHFARATGASPTEPAYFWTIFERGIDPDVDDPLKCHDHSLVPDEWPALNEILQYAARVRGRITESLRSGEAFSDRKLGRSLWLAYEHEALHLETFLYMLLQSERVLPPAGVVVPDFEHLAREASSQREANQWHDIPAAKVKIGLDDPENNSGPDRYFGWDNERPARWAQVHKFAAQSRPISIGDYSYFLDSTKCDRMPSSWTEIAVSRHTQPDTTGRQPSIKLESADTAKIASQAFLASKAVRTVYGPVPLCLVLDWPVMASYDELSAYATWAEGRIPTFEEVRSIYNYVDSHVMDPEGVSSSLISAVNGHLCNDGVEETPPQGALSPDPVGGDTTEHPVPDPNEVFTDITDRNVAFRTWHPTPVTGEGHRLRGQSDKGGLWEWTSTPLAATPGFKPMDLYPGYTADFFDGKHNIVLGGSWATVPRIAGRRSFVNWYQRNYPFTWATARLVRDIVAD